MADPLPPEFLARLAAITAKRAKTVIDHILKHGSISTEQLKDDYGYNHAPRAFRDVKEMGIPLERFSVIAKDGRTIAAYRFGNPRDLRTASTGRRAFPAKFKKTLIEAFGNKCAICTAEFTTPQLEIDHRVPYQVGGDRAGDLDTADYMLVCRQCNRIKSWSCEHCKNWLEIRDPKICLDCYWASPEKFTHVAMQDILRLDITWVGKETASFDSMAKLASGAGVSAAEFAKELIMQAAPKPKRKPRKRS
jgi:hypothetical protein